MRPKPFVLVLFLGVCMGYLGSCPRANADASYSSSLYRMAVALEKIANQGGVRCK